MRIQINFDLFVDCVDEQPIRKDIEKYIAEMGAKCDWNNSNASGGFAENIIIKILKEKVK